MLRTVVRAVRLYLQSTTLAGRRGNRGGGDGGGGNGDPAGGGGEGLRTNQDLAALGFVDGVDVGEPAEAAAAVADDEADGAAPSAARLAGRVLGGDVKVLVEVALDAPASPALHGRRFLSPSPPASRPALFAGYRRFQKVISP